MYILVKSNMTAVGGHYGKYGLHSKKETSQSVLFNEIIGLSVPVSSRTETDDSASLTFLFRPTFDGLLATLSSFAGLKMDGN